MTIPDDLSSFLAGPCFGISGGGPSLEFVDVLSRAGFAFYTVRFEGAAALMAGAAGRLGGRPGIALSIKGPGLANMASGLATAFMEDLPLVAVTEAYASSDPLAKAHKRLDHQGLVGSVTKARLGSSEMDALSRLASFAMAERPGPVVLELADTEGQLPQNVPAAPRSNDAALMAISKARRPVVIAGGLAARLGLSERLNGLSIPIFSTAGAKGIVDETLPHAAGPYTGVGRELAPESELLTEADLVVGIGLRSHEVLFSGLKVPSVNFDDLDLAPGFGFDAVGGASGASRAIESLAEAGAWGSDHIAALKQRMRRELLEGPFLPAQAFECLAEAMPSARMVLDTGYFCTVGEHIWDVSRPDLFLSSGQGRSMGAALPMAVSASLCRREEPTILAIGDGGIGMFFAELSLAVREKSPLLVAFMRDGTHASVRERAVAKGLNESALIVRSPDWTAVASAMGLQATSVATLTDLRACIQKWDRGGPAFVQIEFDPEPYLAMTSDLRA